MDTVVIVVKDIYTAVNVSKVWHRERIINSAVKCITPQNIADLP